MKKMVYFDMDGTIADFYGVDGWLDCLMAHDPRPYAVAEPLFTAEQFAEIVQILQSAGFGIGIISWCSKENNKGFNAEIRKAKKAWLSEHFPYAEEIHIVAYGVPKWSLVRPENRANTILFDDEEQNLSAWEKHGGKAVMAEKLIDLIQKGGF